MKALAKVFKIKYATLATCFCTILFYGCRLPMDNLIHAPEKIYDYHYRTIKENGHSKNCKDQIDLYVDYSTCVAKAEELLTKQEGQATFYHDIRPKIIDCKPNYYSIKGKQIKQENGDLYNLLRGVKEINYADIKAAVVKINENCNQAILITDGEYYEKGLAADHHNNPYLAESFKSWLRKGNEIYILSEPYTEQGLHNKFRYYMIFTNPNIEDEKNVFKKLYRTVEEYIPKIPCTHLSISGLSVKNEYALNNESRVNINLIAPGAYNKGRMEYHYPQVGWEDIWDYIKNGEDLNTGQPLPMGDFVFKGYHVDYSNVKYHEVTKLKLKVTNVYNQFRAFEGAEVEYKNLEPKDLNNIFQIDQEHFNETKEILIRVHENFSGEGLNREDGYTLLKGNYICDEDSLIKENLLRIDILIDETKDAFNDNPKDFESFKWNSISSKHEGAINESVFQSIKNTIEDPSLTPKIMNNGVLYTIYFRTFPSDI